MNSYKYADTDIELSTSLSGDYLLIEIRDFGPGVKQEELPLLKEKYKRGSNSSDKDGAGLGLYLTEYFLTEMGGKLEISNAGNTDIAQDGANATAGAAGFVARVFLHVV
jgi:signal transduction histidine kinase